MPTTASGMLETEVGDTGTGGTDVMVEIAEVLAKRNGTVATKGVVAAIGAMARVVAEEVAVPGRGTQEAAVEGSLRPDHEESRT
ncbi:MAG: hypothetical protein QGI73_03805 [Candidatus Thalassarchaeaceae archaeon]|nr:hypothetical protein [Candidatus Thalassarchaeaceae archaeon]